MSGHITFHIHGISVYRPTTFMLNVATFNQRAINVYRKAGFKDAEVFVNETNGGQVEFLRMAREA